MVSYTLEELLSMLPDAQDGWHYMLCKIDNMEWHCIRASGEVSKYRRTIGATPVQAVRKMLLRIGKLRDV